MNTNCPMDKDKSVLFKNCIRAFRRELKLNKVAMISNSVPSFADITNLFNDLCVVTYVVETSASKTETLFRLQYCKNSGKVSFNVLIDDFIKILFGRCYAIVDITGSDLATSHILLNTILTNREKININRPFLLKISSAVSLSQYFTCKHNVLSKFDGFTLVRIES